MASILEFRKPSIHFRTSRAVGADGGSADVVLFPGVRYERIADEVPAPVPSKSRRRRSRPRDRLDLD